MPGRPIVHIEIPSQDMSKTSTFYQELFGWEIRNDPEQDYVVFHTPRMQGVEPDMGVGGGFPRVDGQMYKPGDVTIYIGSDDIEADLKRIESLGGKRLLPKTEIPHMGWFAFFADPSGNRLALYSPMQM